MRKNTKGFTLVELLAVIVILAVIALIATPVVLSMIEASRKGAAESSMLSYVSATENTILTKLMNNASYIDFDQTYSVEGLTLTQRSQWDTAADTDTGAAYDMSCLDASKKAVACTGATATEPGTDQTANSVVSFNIEIKGDQPLAGEANKIKVDDNVVVGAQLRFGKYFVTYYYDKTTGTATYCSSDEAFINGVTACKEAASK